MIRTGMSTSCVYPLPIDSAFRLAREAGFDGVEIMVTRDPRTRDAEGLLELSRRYEMPILSIHSPVLLFTQFVWGLGPNSKLVRSAELARAVGASTVVVHPPFRWEVASSPTFERTVRRVAAEFGIEVAVENMFPWKLGPVTVRGYSPSSDPVQVDCDAITLDFSHAALGGRDSLEFAHAMSDRLRHVHLCDGAGSMAQGHFIDEHRVPGHGTQPVAEVLQYLAAGAWSGSLIAEVHTPAAATHEERLRMLVETREFARHHIELGRRSRRRKAHSDSA